MSKTRTGFITVAEFYELGLLSEINRRILHPIGLAMSVRKVDGEATEFGAIYVDSDPEGWIYGEPMADVVAAAEKVAAREAEWHPRREAALGFVIQPVDGAA